MKHGYLANLTKKNVAPGTDQSLNVTRLNIYGLDVSSFEFTTWKGGRHPRREMLERHVGSLQNSSVLAVLAETWCKRKTEN